MITFHHLGNSQSERTIWLLEELAIDYKLVLHTRDPLLSPDLSGANFEYIVQRYGHG